MLDNVIRFFTAPIKTTKIEPVKVKPLTIQMFYSTDPSLQLTLEKGRALLENTEFKNAKIEKHTLSKDSQVIGIKKQQNRLFIMHPDCDMEDQKLRAQADKQLCDVVRCETKKDVHCLKATAKGLTLFLIDSRDMRIVETMYSPPPKLTTRIPPST